MIQSRFAHSGVRTRYPLETGTGLFRRLRSLIVMRVYRLSPEHFPSRRPGLYSTSRIFLSFPWFTILLSIASILPFVQGAGHILLSFICSIESHNYLILRLPKDEVTLYRGTYCRPHRMRSRARQYNLAARSTPRSCYACGVWRHRRGRGDGGWDDSA